VHAWSDDGILPLLSGFKANHNTTNALLMVVDDLSRTADLKCGSVLTLLD
jgi:hypothetical protein